MNTHVTIGLVGDYSESVAAHRAIPPALQMASDALSIEVRHEWIPSEGVTSVAPLSRFDGLWCLPGSPYRSMEGALLAIRHARETRTPFLGTCAGFQHAVLEYARNVLGWRDAVHGETSSPQGRVVISLLACPLINETGAVSLRTGTRLASAYGATETAEEYLCSFGVNAEFRSALTEGPLREAATDASGDLRGVELDSHPFFVATLFQPERAALKGKPVPLVASFVTACAARLDGRSRASG